MAPKIDRRNLRNVTVKEGEPILLDVKVQGEPAPDVTWLKNGRIIKETTRNRIENEPYRSVFREGGGEGERSGGTQGQWR